MSSIPTEHAVPRFISSVSEVPAGEWDRLTGKGYPFLRHAFLSALERSGCTTAKNGWEVCHLVIDDLQRPDRLVACMPLYLKTHSYGEYVFDWGWADAYHRHGLEYYPKLLSAVPFTPCAGPRLCVDADHSVSELRPLVIAAIRKRASETAASGWHLLFPDQQQKEQLEGSPLLLRTGCQYQWFNAGYSCFDDFLGTLNSRKRKNLRKERRKVEEQEIRFSIIEGEQITDEQWLQFYRFYSNTYEVRGRSPYLNTRFFTDLGKSMPDSLMLVLAEKAGTAVAGALFFKGADSLYGRYWGSDSEYMFLHFETCYYQGIEYCIRNGYQRFDSGAQGEHKIQRGFRPVPTWSLHWLAREEFQEAVARFVKEEEAYISQYLDHAAEFLPFRKDLDL